MSEKRDNCIVLLVEYPSGEKVSPELAAAFGAERAAQIGMELFRNAYRLASNFADAVLLLSFENSPRHPDLLWLDGEDPGFLEAKGLNRTDRIADAFRMAFNTGSKKALFLNHLSPEIRADWLSQAFDSVNEKTIALGPMRDGSVYLAGLTRNNLKFLEDIPLFSARAAVEISEKAKKNKLSVFSLPEACAVANEEDLRKWLEAANPAPPLLKATIETGEPSQRRQEGKKRHKRGPAPQIEQPFPPDTGQKQV